MAKEETITFRTTSAVKARLKYTARQLDRSVSWLINNQLASTLPPHEQVEIQGKEFKDT